MKNVPVLARFSCLLMEQRHDTTKAPRRALLSCRVAGEMERGREGASHEMQAQLGSRFVVGGSVLLKSGGEAGRAYAPLLSHRK